jgi:hypothetical protein
LNNTTNFGKSLENYILFPKGCHDNRNYHSYYFGQKKTIKEIIFSPFNQSLKILVLTSLNQLLLFDINLKNVNK